MFILADDVTMYDELGGRGVCCKKQICRRCI